MARKRQDDIFKKLNREKPLVKDKELEPLSVRDFKPAKSSFDMMVEKNADNRNKSDSRPENDLRVSPEQKKRTVYKNPQPKRGARLAEGYQDNRGATKENKRELDIFTELAKPPIRREVPGQQTKTPVMRDVSERPLMPPARRDISAASSYPRSYQNNRPDNRVMINPDAQNGLSFRHELKYYINYRDYVILKNALKSLLMPDVNTGTDNTYMIRSLYFDDIYESALREKISGYDNRSKFRIRIYNYSEDVIRFEKKVKKGEYIAKRSMMLSRDEYDQIAAGDIAFLLGRNEPLASEIYYEMKNNMMAPRVIVDYRREAYVYPFGNVRITFDKDLKSGLALTDIFDPDTPVMPIYESGTMVLEVKFDKFLPEHIKRVLNSINAASRSAISKYLLSRKFD